ncbi:hypothetical protein FOXG_08795 [Fusarium oxysporum f. sp. lycopersici 4287]|uniref:Peptidase S8/S53 domain-containing protein n=1 Tax=Fusarium oxysporum f. sp. lycopersici (strain 4287 / CBS 123668 / FGSC 9935 / NRRL 34936) TaxID=426428 RepID=A0A0J9V9E2_FUSO4|nr:hypothetical protein FOXG_08795 [Fusarium oxysporum f. sp. lycopersici 4287]KNB07705.1 hypothetical protein FOXG_08795 [Fusarium oxysporum f. sp. lycopersici 4287]
MKLTTALFGLTGLVGLALSQAIIKNSGVDSAAVVPDSYIVMYKPNMKSGSKQKHEHTITSKAKTKGKEGVIENINLGGFQGYIAEIPASELKDVINSDLVAYIEKDTVVNITAAAAFPFGPLTKRAYTNQQRALGVSLASHMHLIPIPPASTQATTMTPLPAPAQIGSPNTDEYGHGTHVAGTIGGKTYGVAKSCQMFAVKVLDKTGSGTMAGVIQGLQWTVKNAKARGVTKKAVINMSLGGYYTAAVNDAVKAATDAGLTVVVAAGNSDDDASYYSPASAPSAITVGAVESSNYRTAWSNYGSLVDIFAPGSGVLSAWHLSDSGSRYLSGTSMAAPHVAGLAAYFISKEGIRGSAAVTQRILTAAIPNVVSDPNGSNNRLAYNAGGA